MSDKLTAMNFKWELIRNELSSYYPQREAQSILRMIQEVRFGITPLDLCLGRDKPLSIVEREDLKNILERLKKKEPIQYILGQADFCGLSYHVAPGVLIPRPETEELVEWASSELKRDDPAILDIGTGSGCIAVTLAKRYPHAFVTAFDISRQALSIAKTNAERLQVHVTFQKEDILNHLPERASEKPFPSCTRHTDLWDVIISNPPYVCRSEAAEIEQHVLQHEPHEALFVPDNDPLLFYRAIAHYAHNTLRKGGKLYVEINQAWGTETKALFHETGFEEVELRKDFCDRPRMIRCIR